MKEIDGFKEVWKIKGLDKYLINAGTICSSDEEYTIIKFGQELD